jgi:integrase
LAVFLSILYRADRSDKVWLPEHIAAMQRVASPEFWPLFLGAVFMGLRQGDLRKLPWSAYDGNALTWRITKRRKGDAGVKVTIPCVTALRLLLDSLPRNGPLIFTTVTGRAWQKRYVARHFEIARTMAAEKLPEVANLHFHDTRGTAITMLAEAGCSIPEIAAITGHSYRSVSSILEKYLAPDQAPRGNGNSKTGEQRKNRFCKPSANQYPRTRKKDKLSD